MKQSPSRIVEIEIAELIRGHDTFLVCSHVNPDGDAVGSSVALALFLEGQGKKVLVHNQDPVPALYRFLPASDRIQQAIPPDMHFDVSMLVDCAQAERVGDAFKSHAGKGQLVVIDHHPFSGEAVEGTLLIRASAAAASELIYDLMDAYGARPTPEIATALYLGLLTDTGALRFANTTPRALRIAAKLMEAGADHGFLMERLYQSYPQERFKLLAQVLQTLQFPLGGRVAIMEVDRHMYYETNGSEELTDGFVEIPRSIQGVLVALLLREVAPGEYRVSMRSRGSVDVGRVASRLQGGGHPNAAGCTVHGDRETVYHTVLKAVGEALP